MDLASHQLRFLTYELGILSLKAALSTRDRESYIYSREVKVGARNKFRKALRSVLGTVEADYRSRTVSETMHKEFISKTADDLSLEFRDILFGRRFRIGVTQKMINLHLKYLWVAGLVPEPPHCPIDGIVRDKASLNYDWTLSDSMDEYVAAISELKAFADGRTLAVWELEEFRRRADDA